MQTYTDTAHYRRLIFNRPTRGSSMAELAVHIWPAYPVEIGHVSIGELLLWVRNMRQDWVRRMLLECDLKSTTPLDCLSEPDRKWLADDLLNGTAPRDRKK